MAAGESGDAGGAGSLVPGGAAGAGSSVPGGAAGAGGEAGQAVSPIEFLSVIDSMGGLKLEDIAVGKSGEVAVVGAYNRAWSLGGSASLQPPFGGWDGFAATFDAAGVPLWATGIGTAEDEWLQGVTFDDLVTATAYAPTKLLRFDGVGLIEGSDTFEGSFGLDVATSADGDIALVGQILSEPDFGGGIVPVSSGSGVTYVACFDATGNWQWNHHFSGFASQPSDVAIDSLGNIVIVGGFIGDIDFGDGVFAGGAEQYMYLAKFAANGELLFGTPFSASQSIVGWNIAVTSDDDIVVLGSFQGELDFGTGPLTGSLALFVARFDPDGEVRWVTPVDASEHLTSGGVAIDSAGDIVVAGSFAGTMDTPTASSAFERDGIVLKFTGGGDYVTEHVIGGPHDQRIVALDIDDADNIFVGGQYDATAIAGDIFIAKLSF